MQGLVTTERNNLDPAAAPFAKNPRDIEGLTEGASIIEVVMLQDSLRKTLLGQGLSYAENNCFDIRGLNHLPLVMLILRITHTYIHPLIVEHTDL